MQSASNDSGARSSASNDSGARPSAAADTADHGGSPRAKYNIVVAQALYALGALLGLKDTYAGIQGAYVGIAFIVLVQLNYVIAPRIRLLYRL